MVVAHFECSYLAREMNSSREATGSTLVASELYHYSDALPISVDQRKLVFPRAIFFLFLAAHSANLRSSVTVHAFRKRLGSGL
jgi:hypothetical protein